jgi:hypothetical protein
MSIPTTRQEFGKWCLRKLGAPLQEINISDEQIDDRIDEALQYFFDFHMDGSEKMYYRCQFAANNFGGRIYDLKINDGGTLYSNSDTVVFTSNNGVGNGAVATITTDANGKITTARLSANGNGEGYFLEPTITIDTATGSGANVTPIMGGFVQLPSNVIGAVEIFDLRSTYSTSSMFNIRYQMALNDLYTLNNMNLVPYYLARQHITLIEEILIGQTPMRYNRHNNKLYIDTDWHTINEGDWLVVHCYEVIDPAKYPDVWKDKWLQAFCVALIKENYAYNLFKKYQGMPMPGGVMFSAQQMYDESRQEQEALKQELINTYSIPAAGMFVG